MSEEQRRLQEEADRLARKLRRLQAERAAAAAASAAGQMGKAGGASEKGQGAEAEKSSQQALQDLQEAQQELAEARRQAELDLAIEQLAKIEDALTGLKNRQQTVVSETQRLEKLRMTGTEIIGPAPCFFHRVNNVYRWHLLLRGPDPVVALRGMDIARGWYVDVEPVDVL